MQSSLFRIDKYTLCFCLDGFIILQFWIIKIGPNPGNEFIGFMFASFSEFSRSTASYGRNPVVMHLTRVFMLCLDVHFHSDCSQFRGLCYMHWIHVCWYLTMVTIRWSRNFLISVQPSGWSSVMFSVIEYVSVDFFGFVYNRLTGCWTHRGS